jgi:aspartyl-tRNA(Asn)/glutamyl-tRNA(Gln) amidotransferase subunit A
MPIDRYNSLLASWDELPTGKGRLSGKKIAVKDNICVRHKPCTCGSKMLENWIPPYDATVVERVRAAGGIIVGKTNLDEFGMGSSTEHSAFGPTLNPHDIGRVPGGSSGGSAAAVAAGLVDMALGSDTGGSVRQPASFCGVVGIKPTYGLVSRYGLVAYASSLDQIGPIARTVEDAALLLTVIAGADERDGTSIPPGPPVDYTQFLGRGVEGLRIGVLREMMVEGLDPAVRHAVESVITRLSAAGATVEEASVPSIGISLAAYYLIATAEASSNLARFDGVRYGLRIDDQTVESMMTSSRTSGLGAEVKRRIMLGTFALSAGYHDEYFGKAQKVRSLLIRDFATAYSKVDLLVGPTCPVVPFLLGEKLTDPKSMYLTDVCTVPTNLAGHPAISVPAGFTQDGLPIGVQLMAPALREDLLIRAGNAIQEALGLSTSPV